MFLASPSGLGRRSVLILVVALTTGCAVHAPKETHQGRAIFDDKSTVGLLLELPERPEAFVADPSRGGGAMGLLQLGIVTVVTSKLNAHANTLPKGELAALDADLTAALTKKGLAVRRIEPAQLKDFKPAAFEVKEGSGPNKDMRPLQTRLGVDRLLSVKIAHLGFNYPFAGVIPFPTGDAMAHVEGEVSLLDLRTNRFQWFKKVRVLRGVGKAWDEPPTFPALTSKYFEAVEVAKDEILADLEK